MFEEDEEKMKSNDLGLTEIRKPDIPASRRRRRTIFCMTYTPSFQKRIAFSADETLISVSAGPTFSRRRRMGRRRGEDKKKKKKKKFHKTLQV